MFQVLLSRELKDFQILINGHNRTPCNTTLTQLFSIVNKNGPKGPLWITDSHDTLSCARKVFINKLIQLHGAQETLFLGTFDVFLVLQTLLRVLQYETIRHTVGRRNQCRLLPVPNRSISSCSYREKTNTQSSPSPLLKIQYSSSHCRMDCIVYSSLLDLVVLDWFD